VKLPKQININNSPLFGSIKMTSARKRDKINLLTSSALPPSLPLFHVAFYYLSLPVSLPPPLPRQVCLLTKQTKIYQRVKHTKHPSLNMPSKKQVRQERRQAKYFARGKQQQDSNPRSQAQAAPQRPLPMSSSASPGNNRADQTTTNNAHEQNTDALRLGRYVVVRNES